jgi:hypothetical protein
MADLRRAAAVGGVLLLGVGVAYWVRRMSAPLSITCPSCQDQFPVPAEVLKVDILNNQVLVRLDRTEAFGHFTTCAIRKNRPRPEGKSMVPVEGVSARQLVVPATELAGRIHQMLDMRAFVATGGSRACTLCGVNGQDCMVQLDRKRVPCCSGCANGNTHPAPKQDATCAEWGAEHGAAN